MAPLRRPRSRDCHPRPFRSLAWPSSMASACRRPGSRQSARSASNQHKCRLRLRCRRSSPRRTLNLRLQLQRHQAGSRPTCLRSPCAAPPWRLLLLLRAARQHRCLRLHSLRRDRQRPLQLHRNLNRSAMSPCWHRRRAASMRSRRSPTCSRSTSMSCGTKSRMCRRPISAHAALGRCIES